MPRSEHPNPSGSRHPGYRRPRPVNVRSCRVRRRSPEPTGRQHPDGHRDRSHQRGPPPRSKHPPHSLNSLSSQARHRYLITAQLSPARLPAPDALAHNDTNNYPKARHVLVNHQSTRSGRCFHSGKRQREASPAVTLPLPDDNAGRTGQRFTRLNRAGRRPPRAGVSSQPRSTDETSSQATSSTPGAADTSSQSSSATSPSGPVRMFRSDASPCASVTGPP